MVQYKHKGAMDEEWCVPILIHTPHTHTHRAQYNYFVLYYVPFPEVTSHLVSRNPPNISSQEKIASFCIETPSLHTIFTLHCCAGYLLFLFGCTPQLLGS